MRPPNIILILSDEHHGQVLAHAGAVIAHITFEYRRPGDPEWREGRGTCYSSYTFPSRRYLEGCSWQE
jgi:hypothetical protein